MSVVIAGIVFDGHEYDPRGDVLYLSAGPVREAARTLETPEGYAVDFDESGAVIGLVLLNVRWTLNLEGVVTLTMPEQSGSYTIGSSTFSQLPELE